MSYAPESAQQVYTTQTIQSLLIYQVCVQITESNINIGYVHSLLLQDEWTDYSIDQAFPYCGHQRRRLVLQKTRSRTASYTSRRQNCLKFYGSHDGFAWPRCRPGASRRAASSASGSKSAGAAGRAPVPHSQAHSGPAIREEEGRSGSYDGFQRSGEWLPVARHGAKTHG
jgi:hypothetical protein